MKKYIVLFVCALGVNYCSAQNVVLENRAEELALCGKVWGFVKYHHPRVVAGRYNMDKEWCQLFQKVINSDGTDVLLDWVAHFGEVGIAQELKQMPNNAWINLLGSELSQRLAIIEKQKRGTRQYYTVFDRDGEFMGFQNEGAYSTGAPFSDEYKLLGLFKYWNWVQYYYPYRYMLSDWDALLPKYVSKMLAARDKREYRIVLCELVAEINDTHITLVERNGYTVDAVLEKLWGQYAVPVIVDFINGRAIVTNYRNEAVRSLDIGDEIIAINGRAVTAIVDSLWNTVSASNRGAKLRVLADKIIRTNDLFVTLQIKRGDNELEVVARTYPVGELNLRKGRAQIDKPGWSYAADSIGYLYIGNLTEKALIEGLSEFRNKTKGIIIDLRSYPRDDMFGALDDFLNLSNEPDMLNTIPDYTTPGQFVFLPQSDDDGEVSENGYQKPVVILVNEITQSETETLAMYISLYPKAITIGSQSAGANAATTVVSLPYGVSVSLPVIGIYYPDGSEVQGVGVHIDEYVYPTVDAIRNGTDNLINRAIEIIVL